MRQGILGNVKSGREDMCDVIVGPNFLYHYNACWEIFMSCSFHNKFLSLSKKKQEFIIEESLNEQAKPLEHVNMNNEETTLKPILISITH